MTIKKLSTYISIVTKGNVVACDDYIGSETEDLIYKLILEIKDQNKSIFSRKLEKGIISRLKSESEVVSKKLNTYFYRLEKENQNGLTIVSFYKDKVRLSSYS